MRKLIVAALLACVAPLACADMFVTEFAGPPVVSVYYQAASTPALANQVVNVAASSTQSAVFSADTKLVRVHCEEVCFVLFGANPTATLTSMRLAANASEYFVVVPGQRVAVIGL